MSCDSFRVISESRGLIARRRGRSGTYDDPGAGGELWLLQNTVFGTGPYDPRVGTKDRCIDLPLVGISDPDRTYCGTKRELCVTAGTSESDALPTLSSGPKPPCMFESSITPRCDILLVHSTNDSQMQSAL